VPGVGAAAAVPSAPEPEPAHDAIVACGERFSIGAPVVLWTDPGGYDAYSTLPHFATPANAEPLLGMRYLPGRRVKREGHDTPMLGALAGASSCFNELRGAIDMFVVHYDVCGVSRTCFKVLQDQRKLSVHFMLDIDGTLYQTLDLAETCWHARQANPRSIGVEIANMGAYAPGTKSALDTWYAQDEHGTRIVLPKAVGDGGVRTPDFVGRPARDERIRGTIQGAPYEQYDLTPQQYDTLVKLASKLCEIFPRITPDAPRGADGKVTTVALSDAEFAEFHGILGHYHVTKEKQDPGPAFDWDVFLERVREQLATSAPKP
jgi:N-acetyl-anhydromuramyl-L-alanine amidase AmpD